MNPAPSPAAWYPDPSRSHEWRYFDGHAWTDDVSDGPVVGKSALGPLPPGLLAWATPALAVRAAQTGIPLVRVPRGKMWTLAVLSLFVFWIRTPERTIVLPLGTIFAIWCWHATSEAMKSHRAAGSGATREISAARWVAFGLAVLGFLQAGLWTRFRG